MKPRLSLLLLSLIAAGASAAETAAPTSKATVTPTPGTSTAPAATAPAPATSAAKSTAASAPNRAAAASTAAPAADNFENNFRVVLDRNIFNANRTGRRERTESAPVP